MQNKRWEQKGDTYKLIFCPYYDDVTITTLYYDKNLRWRCKGDMVSLYCLLAETLDEAKQEVEDAVELYFTDKIEYYSHLLKAFKEDEHVRS